MLIIMVQRNGNLPVDYPLGVYGPEMPSHVGCGKNKKKQNKGWLNYQLHNNITNDEDPTGIQYLMLQRCDSL